MSNLFTRVRYDTSEMSLFDKTNTDSNKLLLDPSVKESMTACYAPAGSRCAQSEMTRPYAEGMLNLGQKADIENRLMNRDKELNDHVGRTNKSYETNFGNVPNNCNVKETLTFENSRFTNPIENYREMYTAPYALTPYLFVSPQTVHANNDKFMTPNRYGESARYMEKKDKYALSPKQFATLKPNADYTEKYKGLLPQSGPVTPAYAFTQ
jgi:hypothetical protein